MSLGWAMLTVRLTLHNVHYMLSLMGAVRAAILEDRYPDFLRKFFARIYPKGDYPSWAVTSLRSVGVELNDVLVDMSS